MTNSRYTVGVTSDEASQARIIQLLGDSLYSDLETSATRELISNAFDANTSTQKTCIDIYLPSEEDKTFYVQDYGPGLGEEGIHLVNHLGESTRRDNQKMTGSFGVGGLTMHNLSSAAILVDINNGVKRTYQYTQKIGQTGELTQTKTLQLLSEEKTTQHSGLRVECPLKDSVSVDRVIAGVVERVQSLETNRYNLVSTPKNHGSATRAAERLARIHKHSYQLTPNARIYGNVIDSLVEAIYCFKGDMPSFYLDLYGVTYSVTDSTILNKIKAQTNEIASVSHYLFSGQNSLQECREILEEELPSLGVEELNDEQLFILLALQRYQHYDSCAGNVLPDPYSNKKTGSIKDDDRKIVHVLLTVDNPRSIKLSTSRESLQNDEGTAHQICCEVMKFLKDFAQRIYEDYFLSPMPLDDLKALIFHRISYGNTPYSENGFKTWVPYNLGTSFFTDSEDSSKAIKKSFPDLRIFCFRSGLIRQVHPTMESSSFGDFSHLGGLFTHLFRGKRIIITNDKHSDRYAYYRVEYDRVSAGDLKVDDREIKKYWQENTIFKTYCDPALIRQIWLDVYPFLSEFSNSILTYTFPAPKRSIQKQIKADARTVKASKSPYTSLCKTFLNGMGCRSSRSIVSYDSMVVSHASHQDRIKNGLNYFVADKTQRNSNLKSLFELLGRFENLRLELDLPQLEIPNLVPDKDGLYFYRFMRLTDKPYLNFQSLQEQCDVGDVELNGLFMPHDVVMIAEAYFDLLAPVFLKKLNVVLFKQPKLDPIFRGLTNAPFLTNSDVYKTIDFSDTVYKVYQRWEEEASEEDKNDKNIYVSLTDEESEALDLHHHESLLYDALYLSIPKVREMIEPLYEFSKLIEEEEIAYLVNQLSALCQVTSKREDPIYEMLGKFSKLQILKTSDLINQVHAFLEFQNLSFSDCFSMPTHMTYHCKGNNSLSSPYCQTLRIHHTHGKRFDNKDLVATFLKSIND